MLATSAIASWLAH